MMKPSSRHYEEVTGPRPEVDEGKLLGVLQKRYNEKGRDFLLKSSRIAKEMNTSPYKIRELLTTLERKKMVERTELSKCTIVWRTCFGRRD